MHVKQLKHSDLTLQNSIPNNALFCVTPLLAAAALTALAELVAELIKAGVLFANASKTLKTPLPPQTVFSSPVQGTLQSVWFLAHSPPTKPLHQHWLPCCTPAKVNALR
jgi:hypothetical protein